MSTIETVKIKHGDGFAIVNATDFNPSKHELVEPVDAATLERWAMLREAEKAEELDRQVVAHLERARGHGEGGAYVAFAGDPNFSAPGFVPSPARPRPYDGRSR